MVLVGQVDPLAVEEPEPLDVRAEPLQSTKVLGERVLLAEVGHVASGTGQLAREPHRPQGLA
jgi:hypothetical protein